MAINVEKLFENSDLFCRMQRFFKAGKSFGIDCISKFGKLFLVKNFSERTKILWIVESEQAALRYKNDLKCLFDNDAAIFPYQESGLYDANIPNIYKYFEQISILQNWSNQLMQKHLKMLHKSLNSMLMKNQNIS